MREHIDQNIESLKEKVQPIIDTIISELKVLYEKHELRDVSDYWKWETFFRLAKEDPDQIKFYISRLPLKEQQLTLKIGVDTNEEKNQEGFILPITIIQALALLAQITSEDYRLICKYAAISYISLLQNRINSTEDERIDDEDLESLNETFIKTMKDYMKPLIDLVNKLEKESEDEDWREIIQLYYEQ